ncbi:MULTISPECIES: KTSC domain-containing protein [unclassified Mesorhizobium]|uniref:KTSC domain-containing protein n=1 Tax=unclassified Mesorhizobium TaxID=325217 RepID=UPI000A0018A9|nr:MULTISPECIES: KTSC domain-containing protein [unclassified Mesorhizobium]
MRHALERPQWCGKHYEVLDVPADAVAAFKVAFAKGVYFNSHIRNRYTVRLAPER